MPVRDPEPIVEGPGAEGGFTARWPGFDTVRGEGETPQEARRALFDALVDELRAGLSEEERTRVREYKQLPYVERTKRASESLALTWTVR
jgi:hypothetical protein